MLLFAAIFALHLFQSRDRAVIGGGYKVTAAFDRVDGISPGSEVKISGIPVGSVAEQRLDRNNYSAILTLSLDSSVQLPTDTSAEIASSGILGDKYVALVPGGDSEYIKDGGVVEFTQSAISLESIVSKIAFGMDNSQQKKAAGSEEQIEEVQD